MSRTIGRHGGHPERGDIVLGWLTRLVVVLGLLGLIGFDAMSIAVARVGASDDANQAAQDASEAWKSSHHDIQQAYNAAAASTKGKNEEVRTDDFTVDPDGTVHLTLDRTATTLLLYRLHATAKWADVTAHGTGTYLGS